MIFQGRHLSDFRIDPIFIVYGTGKSRPPIDEHALDFINPPTVIKQRTINSWAPKLTAKLSSLLMVIAFYSYVSTFLKPSINLDMIDPTQRDVFKAFFTDT